ncbi:MAG TPA: SRPBCC family protein [Candidatus Limnocylindrales bacterium]
MLITERSATIDRSVEDAFRFVSDPMNDPAWHTTVLEVTRTSGGALGVGSTFRAMYDGTRKTLSAAADPTELREVTAEILEYVPNVRSTLRVTFPPNRALIDRLVGRQVDLSFRLEPASGGSRLHRRVEIHPARVMLPAARLLRSGADERNDYLLGNIRSALEA